MYAISQLYLVPQIVEFALLLWLNMPWNKCPSCSVYRNLVECCCGYEIHQVCMYCLAVHYYPQHHSGIPNHYARSDCGTPNTPPDVSHLRSGRVYYHRR